MALHSSVLILIIVIQKGFEVDAIEAEEICRELKV